MCRAEAIISLEDAHLCRCFTSLCLLPTVLLTVCPPRGSNPLDHRDNSFSRSRSSSVTSIDKEVREAITSFHFTETFARKGDGVLTPCLYVGTSVGTILGLAITVPPAGEQRQLQPVAALPIGEQTDLARRARAGAGLSPLLPSLRHAGAAEGHHLEDGLPGFFRICAAPRLRALVRNQRNGARRGEREGPQEQAQLGVPLHVPGTQRGPVRRGVFRETGPGPVPALPDVHLQTQHHRDLLHPEG